MLMSMSAGIGAEEGRYIGSAALMRQALGRGSGRGRFGRCCEVESVWGAEGSLDLWPLLSPRT